MFSTRSFVVASALVASLSISIFAAEESKVIKEGMKEFHKGDTALIKKVLAGEGSEEELKKIQAFYKKMSAEKPPLGDEASWKEKTIALSKAADAVLAKDPNGIALLKEAANCKACHSVHKPK